MALRKIVTVGDPILTKVCRPVTKFDQKLAILIEDMIETMHDANGVGLAGPQVGILRRVVVVDAGDEDIELVNPGVVEVGEETGALADLLTRIANTYDDEVDNAVAGMTAAIEPALIIVLAVVVGTIVIAMFLPMIKIISSVSGAG